VEPYLSWKSFLIYRFFHPEDLICNINSLNKKGLEKDKKSNFANLAIPSLIFKRYRNQFFNKFPHLNIIKKEKADFGFFMFDSNGEIAYIWLWQIEQIFHYTDW